MGAWAPMWRRARRLALRSPGRTIATGSLVGVSVAVVVVLAAWPWTGSVALAGSGELPSGVPDASRVDAAYVLDSNDAPIDPMPQEAQTIIEVQPPGATTATIEHFLGFRLDRDNSVDESVAVVQTDWHSPLVAGTEHLIDGDPPGPGEVVISPRIAATMHLAPGDTLNLAQPVASLRVVGIGSPGPGNRSELLTSPGEFKSVGPPRYDHSTPMLSGVTVLTDVPPGQSPPVVHLAQPDSPARSEIYPVSPADMATAGPVFHIEPAAFWSIGILLGVAVMLTSGAAFGIGAARRRRAAGLFAVNGAGDAAMRIAAITEALVISVPAAVLGALAPVIVARLWVAFRAPRWDLAASLRFNPLLVVGAIVFVVAAGLIGTLWFTRTIRLSSIPALLDGRLWSGRLTSDPRRSTVRGNMSTIIVLAVLVLAFLGLMWSRNVGFATASTNVAAVVVVVGSFMAGVWLVLMVARRLLSRKVSGRVVMRDLIRRPVGAAVVSIVVALWSTLMIGSAAEIRYESVGNPFENASASSTRMPVEPASVPTTVVGPGSSSPESGPLVEGAPTVPRWTGATTISPRGRSRIVQRGTEPEPGSDLSVDDLARHLEAAGMTTVRAQLGSFTGECAVCPDGYIPTIAVLSGVDGAGQTPEVNRLLSEGYVVTPLDIGIPVGSTVGGMPIVTAPVNVSGAVAVVLGSEVPDGLELTDPSTVLVGSVRGVDTAARQGVAEVLADAGATADSDDMSFMQDVTLGQVGRLDGVSASHSWLVWGLWVIPLVFVTLGATVVHRREHGDAARVFNLLGAGSGVARRLAAYTAALIAGTGVTVGIGVGVLGVLTVVGGSRYIGLADVLWSPEFLGACALALAVPVVVGAVAWVIPPAPRVDERLLAPA